MNIFHFGDVIGGDQVWWVSISLQSNKVIVIGQFFHFILKNTQDQSIPTEDKTLIVCKLFMFRLQLITILVGMY